jgi:hypothetical protein
MRRALGDAMVSAGALTVLLATLVLVDPRVRDQMTMRFGSQHASTEIVSVGTRAKEIAGVAIVALREQSLEHAPMMIFALAATVLVVFMLRT